MAKATKNQGKAKELTPEQKIAELEAANKKLSKDLKNSQKDKPANPRDVTFEIEEEDGSASNYCFTCMKFNMDNIEYDAKEVVDNEQAEVLAKLVQMNSGIIQLIED